MNRKNLPWIVVILLLLVAGCGVLFYAVNSIGSTGSEFASVTGDAVALVRVEGTILPGEGGGSNPFNPTAGAFSTTIVDNLKKAEEDDRVKAVVLAVDSPGGSVFASDEIALQIEAMEKPVVSAMGSMAASGGYYVSAPTDEIWASPHTLTCSIGVIAQLLNYDELAAEYGVETVVYKSGNLKDMGNPFRDPTEEEDVVWQAMIDEAYDAFVKVVADGRGLDEGTVREFADGRICTGKQAQELNLVDSLGYLPDVIARAGELGGIEGEPPTIEYREGPSVFDILSGAMSRPSLLEEARSMFEYRPGATLMYLYSGR